MYAFLEGQLVASGPPTVLSVAGVGYELHLPERTRRGLPAVGDAVRLYVHLAVREDDLSLYAFATPDERDVFRTLIGVSGVGPKVALAILGSDEREQILGAASRGDVTPLTAVKGIGRKTAERLGVELRDKPLPWASARTSAAATRPAQRAAAGRVEDDDDATLALIALGVPRDRALEALASFDDDERQGRSVEDVVRLALRRVRL